MSLCKKLMVFSKLDKSLEILGNSLFCNACVYPISVDQKGHVIQVST